MAHNQCMEDSLGIKKIPIVESTSATTTTNNNLKDDNTESNTDTNIDRGYYVGSPSTASNENDVFNDDIYNVNFCEIINPTNNEH
jgi:hypothetical protein